MSFEQRGRCAQTAVRADGADRQANSPAWATGCWCGEQYIAGCNDALEQGTMPNWNCNTYLRSVVIRLNIGYLHTTPFYPGPCP